MIAWIRRLLTASRACGALAPSSPATRCVGSLSRGAALLAARPAEAQPTRGTVLIADDDLDLAIAVSMRLERLGLCVRRSSDSLHALLGAQLVDFDLVIMDVQMPSGNGLAVCEMMADIPSLANVPVIVFTGRTDAETKKRCRELGAHYVAKTGQSMQVLVELTCRILHIPPPLEAPAGPSLDANADSTGDGGDQNSPGGRTSTSMGRVPCAAAARREFRSRVEQLARDENKAVAEIRIRRMRSDWSSCSPRGRITFNAALLQMSVEFQNQVIAQTLDGLPNATGAERTETGGAIVPFESFASMNGAASAATSNVPATIKLLDVMAAPSHATPPAPADADANANNGAPPPPKRPRLLCIDDDPAIANALSLRLRPFEIDVVRASTGMKGYAAALAERPDVILCDLVMPDGDGLYVFRRLLDHTLTADIPFLVLTGQTNPAVRREVLSSGAAGYLFKPLDFDELLSHLARFIRIARTPPSAVRPHAADRRLVFREPWSDGVADDFRRSAPGEKPIPV